MKAVPDIMSKGLKLLLTSKFRCIYNVQLKVSTIAVYAWEDNLQHSGIEYNHTRKENKQEKYVYIITRLSVIIRKELGILRYVQAFKAVIFESS